MRWVDQKWPSEPWEPSSWLVYEAGCFDTDVLIPGESLVLARKVPVSARGRCNRSSNRESICAYQQGVTAGRQKQPCFPSGLFISRRWCPFWGSHLSIFLLSHAGFYKIIYHWPLLSIWSQGIQKKIDLLFWPEDILVEPVSVRCWCW